MSAFCKFLAQFWGVDGLVMGLGVITAIVLEYFPGFGDWETKWKQIVYLVIVAFLGIAAWFASPLANCVRPELWDVIVAIGAAFMAGTVAHRIHVGIADAIKNGKK